MFEKSGKYYADWYEGGVRKRKSFTSQRAALLYEEDMKAEASPKQRARGRKSPASSARNSKGQSKGSKQSTGPLVIVSGSGKASSQRNSVRPTSRKPKASSKTKAGSTTRSHIGTSR